MANAFKDGGVKGIPGNVVYYKPADLEADDNDRASACVHLIYILDQDEFDRVPPFALKFARTAYDTKVCVCYGEDSIEFKYTPITVIKESLAKRKLPGSPLAETGYVVGAVLSESECEIFATITMDAVDDCRPCDDPDCDHTMVCTTLPEGGFKQVRSECSGGR